MNLSTKRRLWQGLRPYLILTLFAAPVLIPLLRPEIACTDDGALYFYQPIAMRYALSNGLVFSRWLPDAALGYGLPFFNYREPLPRFAVLILMLLGIKGGFAVNLTTILTVLPLGWGTYRFTRDVFGSEVAGIIAGVAAISAPFTLIGIYRRGSLPELMGLALIPWIGWAFWMTIQNQRVSRVITAAFLWAALLLTHNISALVFAPALAAYSVMLTWLAHNNQGRKASLLLVGAFLGGLGLAAFYWAPAFIEKDLIQVFALTTTRNNTFLYNFLPPSEIFALPAPANLAHLNPPMMIRISIVLIGLAAIGSFAGWLTYEKREHRAHILALSSLAIMYLLLALPIALPIWEAFPTLSFVQFPWRMIGRTIFPLTILAGVGSATIIERLQWKWSTSLTAIPALIFVIIGLPDARPLQWCPIPDDPHMTDVNEIELTALMGLDNEGAYFPVTATRPTTSPLLEDYATDRTPQRFDESLLPSESKITLAYRPLGADIHIQTPEAFEARYLVYHFPGWRVWIDGGSVDTYPEAQTGLLHFTIPAGDHDIKIRFHSTPLRTLASLISGLSLVILVVVGIAQQRTDRSHEAPYRASDESSMSPLWIALTVTGGILLTAVLFWPSESDSPWQVNRPPILSQGDDVVFGNAVRLLDTDIRITPPPLENEIRVETSWTRIGAMDGNTQLALSLVDEHGFVWSNKEGERPPGYEAPPYATFLWPENTFASDSQLVSLLPGTPAGHYEISATLFNPDTFQVLRVPLEDGGSSASTSIGAIDIRWPHHPPSQDDLVIQYPTDKIYNDISLLGYNIDRETIIPGNQILLTLFWEAASDIETLPPLSVHLNDDLRLQVFSSRPTGTIPTGARWREQYRITVPRETHSGDYTLTLNIADTEAFPLRDIAISPIERLWTQPQTEQTLNTLFDDKITLIGLSADLSEQQLIVELVWQSKNTLAEDYAVFIHALDAEGNVLTQSDSRTATSTRPTYTWLPGEFIIDPHELMVEPHKVTSLRIGLYDPATTIPLSLDDTNTYLVIPIGN